MYSVDELIDHIDRDSEVDDDLERVIEEDHTNDPDRVEVQENEDVDTEKKSEKKTRKVSKRPRLDLERLKGPKGLPCMEKLFSQIEFKGPGYERQDLAKVMNTLQYWTHRLFPKNTFDETLEQLERLGHKKPVQTLRFKVVYDMLEEDVPVQDEPELDDERTQEPINPINEFDLLRQSPMPTTSSQPIRLSPERVELTQEQNEAIERNRLLAVERRKARLEAMKKKQEAQNANFDSLSSSQTDKNTQESGAGSQVELTEEQLKIIAGNRKLAVEKRRARMEFLQLDSQPPSQTVSILETNEQSQKDTCTPPINVDNNSQIDTVTTNNTDVVIIDPIKEINNTESSNDIEINCSQNMEVDSAQDGTENDISGTESSNITLNNSQGHGENTKNIIESEIDPQEIEINKTINTTDIEKNTNEDMDIDEEMI